MFPSEFPLAATRQLFRFLNGDDRDYGRLALAVYQLAGFGLGKAFPQAAFLSDSVPDLTEDEIKTLSSVLNPEPELKAVSPEVKAVLEIVMAKLVRYILTNWL